MHPDKKPNTEFVWDEVTLGIRDDHDGDTPVIRLYACPYGPDSEYYKVENFYPYAILYTKHSIEDDYDLDWFYDQFLDGGELVDATPERILSTAKALQGIAKVSGCEFIMIPETLEQYGVLIPTGQQYALSKGEEE